MLHSPERIRALRKLPLVGDLIHVLSRRMVSGDERTWAQVKAGPGKGLWLELNPRTGQQYLRGQAETAIQRVLVERLRPGMVFYDLGANIGLFSLLAARLVSPAGKVVSFEPDPDNASRLKRNIARNNYQNVTVLQKGIWSSTGKRGFRIASTSSPDHGLGRFSDEEGDTQNLMVDCVALDDIVGQVAAPDAIKCDVEGAEIDVLLGSKRILQERKPWIICELHSETNRAAAAEILKQLNYRIEDIDADHILALPNISLN